MRRLFKYLFRLVIVLAIAFVGYAFFSDLPPPMEEREVTLPLPQDAVQDAGQDAGQSAQ